MDSTSELLAVKGGVIIKGRAPSWARLQGLILHRLDKTTRAWIRITPDDFIRCTGLSRRQFFYAKRRLEQHQFSQVVFQTTLKTSGRGWQIVASRRPSPVANLGSGNNKSGEIAASGVPTSSGSLLNRFSGGMGGEPPVSFARFGRGLFTRGADGQDRRCRVNLLITPTASGTECNAYRGIPKGMQLSKPPWQGLEPSAGMIRLAHHLKRVLEGLHWDNCKVNYSAGMAFRYAETMLLRGYSYEIILDGYEAGLSAMHATATDVGLELGNPRLRFEASSTVNRARLYCHATQIDQRRSFRRKSMGQSPP